MTTFNIFFIYNGTNNKISKNVKPMEKEHTNSKSLIWKLFGIASQETTIFE